MRARNQSVGRVPYKGPASARLRASTVHVTAYQSCTVIRIAKGNVVSPVRTHLYPIHSAAYWFARSLAKTIIIHHVVGGRRERRHPAPSVRCGLRGCITR